MKTAIAESSLFTLGFIGLIIFALTFTSCSEEETFKSAQMDTYVIAVSVETPVNFGTTQGDFHGDNEVAKQYLIYTEFVQPGGSVSVEVAKGETLFVDVDTDKALDLFVAKNGEEVLKISRSARGSVLIFANK